MLSFSLRLITFWNINGHSPPSLGMNLAKNDLSSNPLDQPNKQNKCDITMVWWYHPFFRGLDAMFQKSIDSWGSCKGWQIHLPVYLADKIWPGTRCPSVVKMATWSRLWPHSWRRHWMLLSRGFQLTEAAISSRRENALFYDVFGSREEEM